MLRLVYIREVFLAAMAVMLIVAAPLGAGITYERFGFVPGQTIDELYADSDFPGNPSFTEELDRFASPVNVGDSIGTRIHGYLVAPETGNYRFWVSSEDNSELLLAPGPLPNEAVVIAYLESKSGIEDWTHSPFQESALIPLVAGQRYYISAVANEQNGNDHLEVGWEIPSRAGLGPEVIDGDYLEPFGPVAPLAFSDSVDVPVGGTVTIAVTANDYDPNDQGSIDIASLQVADPPAEGSVTLVPGLGFRYAHTGASPGSDSFTYTVADTGGLRSDVATVSISVSSGNRLARPPLHVPFEAPTGEFSREFAFPGMMFDLPVGMATPPGESNRLFILEKNGKIQVISNVVEQILESEPFLDISSRTIPGSEDGLLGLAFHPNYAENGYFYVFYSNSEGERSNRLARFSVDPDNPNRALPDSEYVILDQQDDFKTHNAGDVGFGLDGYLYVTLGDEGGRYDQYNNAQYVDKDFFSGVIRIDIDRRPENLEPNPHPAVVIDDDTGLARYKVPVDNPLAGMADTSLRTEFYAIGLRNPWRFHIDPVNGNIWVGDVGQQTYEEINLIRNGGNYGWANREGFFEATGDVNPPVGFETYDDPVHAYPRGQGTSVTGGTTYYGTQYSQLYGKYIFGDYVSGRIWVLSEENGEYTTEYLERDQGIVAFGNDPSNGDVIWASINLGQLRRLVLDSTVEQSPLPEKLSETGIFVDVESLELNPGYIAYEPNISFWSDYAEKRRWVSLPDTSAKVDIMPDGEWESPAGTIWVKHFDMRMDRDDPESKRRIETRLLMRTDDGAYGVSYRWNDEQTDADLVPDSGAQFDLDVTVDGQLYAQTYNIPSRTQCMQCHTPGARFSLSFNTRQLNREGTIHGDLENQIQALADAGYFEEAPGDPASLPAFPELDDTSISLSERAKAYLAVNCSSCHRASAGAFAEWTAEAGLPVAQLGVIGAVPVRSYVSDEARLVTRGDASQSVLWNRIAGSDGFTRMPPIGSNEVDPVGEALIRDWIESLDSTVFDREAFLAAHFGNPDAVDPAIDSDGDGLSNTYEYLLKTLPTVADPSASFVAPVEPQLDGSLRMSFRAIGDRMNRIEYSHDLVDWHLWEVPGSVATPAADAEMTLKGPNPGDGHVFFRHVVEEL